MSLCTGPSGCAGHDGTHIYVHTHTHIHAGPPPAVHPNVERWLLELHHLPSSHTDTHTHLHVQACTEKRPWKDKCVTHSFLHFFYLSDVKHSCLLEAIFEYIWFDMCHTGKGRSAGRINAPLWQQEPAAHPDQISPPACLSLWRALTVPAHVWYVHI